MTREEGVVALSPAGERELVWSALMARVLLPILLLALASCGDPPVTMTPDAAGLGKEICDNGIDDNADEKVDCFDPRCFTNAACVVREERCDNNIDDNGDQLVDCSDPTCDGKSCGSFCTCINGRKVISTATGGGGGSRPDAGQTGGGGGSSTGGGTATGGGGAPTGGGSATGGGGGSAATGGGGSGPTGGGAATGGGGGSMMTGGGTAATGGGGSHPSTETNCADNQDNDADNATDCDDADCVGITCGMGCTCALNHRTETSCADNLDNDGDQLRDCADPDCFGVGTEICNDGIDNTCDRAIDCGDSKCSGNAACTALNDGKPCLSDTQCAGGRCQTEGAFGFPNGQCTNATSCTLGTNAGCHNGRCIAGNGFNTCRQPCTGQGLTGPTACRAGFVCADPDGINNDNNFCFAACSSDSECAGNGSGYGCNPWSKLCTIKDRGLGKYGAACVNSGQCETDLCFTGSDFPHGYCTGYCRGDTRNCAANGRAQFPISPNDNLGLCAQACTTSAECRNADHYYCWGSASDAVCQCVASGAACFDNAYCCSGICNGGICN